MPFLGHTQSHLHKHEQRTKLSMELKATWRQRPGNRTRTL